MPTLERFSPEALRSTVVTFRDTMKAHAPGINRLNVYPVPDGDTGTNMARTLDAVVAELDGAGAGHGPHVRRDPPRQPDGRPRQQRRHPQPDPARAGLHAEGRRRGHGPRKVAEALKARQRVGLPGGAEADRGHHPHRRPRVGRGRPRRGAERGESLVGVLARRPRGRQAALDRTPEHAARAEGRRRGRRRRRGVPAAARRGAARGRRRAAARARRSSTARRCEQLDAVVAPPRRGRGRRQRAALRGHVLPRSRRRADPGLQAGLGRDRRLHRRGRRRRHLELPRAHQRHRRRRSRWRSTSAAARSRSASPTCSRRWPRSTRHREAAARRARTRPAPAPACRRSPARWWRCPAATASSELFGQLGVQGVVTGGQTLNPSTAELLAAVEAVNAQQVVVLPNNKNIIPVAEQLDALTTKTVVVVPTRSMPEALAALVVYDPEADAADQRRRDDARRRESVATGEVTQAVRATNSDAGPIDEGDWIGIVRGDGIVAVSGSLDGATVALLDHLVGPTGARSSPSSRASTPPPGTPTSSTPGSTSTGPASRSRCTAARSRSTRTSSASSDRRDERPVAPLTLPRPVGHRRRAAEGRRRARSSPRCTRWVSSTVLDLLTTYPRRWVDRTNECRVSDLVPGQEALVLVDRAQRHQADRAQPAHASWRPWWATAAAGSTWCSSTSRGARSSSARACRSRCSASPRCTAAGCR